ncbi:family 14 polysaccharide lyase [Melampsora americana]|nr:family 14 polysaccharide lyase [Melampsora americana]
MDNFNITQWAWGKKNLQLMRSIPQSDLEMNNLSMNNSNLNSNNDTVMQVLYPKGSANPDRRNNTRPIGGIGFYASPLDLSTSTNVSLYYSVFFPSNFDFNKGGKLPGLYGGSTGCSGGLESDECFSTRLMFRTNGTGELYLYAPKSRQVPSLCQTPPLSDCNAEYGYSIGRGAWNFTRGGWTNVRQDIWLNNGEENDGGFNIWIDGQLALHSDQVYYRHPVGSIKETPVKANQSESKSLNSSNSSASPSDSSNSSESSLQATGGTNRFLRQVRPDNSSFVSPTSLGLPHPIGKNFSTDYNQSSNPGGLISTSTPLTNAHLPGTSRDHANLARRLNLERRTVLNLVITPPLNNSATPELVDLPPTNETNSSQRPVGEGEEAYSQAISGIRRQSMTVRKESAHFMGIMADTFFGGHDPSWASSKDQYSYFNRFGLVIR